MVENGIYEGMVRHARFKPKPHKLSYRVYSLFVDLEKIDALSKELKYFSRNRFNLLSFYDRDHGAGRPDNILSWVRGELAKADIVTVDKIYLLFYPRILGYAFNPIATYYCYDKGGNLVALLYAVRNTFGGRHAYLIKVGSVEKNSIHQQTDKLFHVSPFIDMDMRYYFTVRPPGEKLSLSIRVDDDAGTLLMANFSGKRSQISDASLKRLFLRYPFLTFKVIFAIHIEAIKLLFKGVRLKKGAPDPKIAVTIVEACPEEKRCTST